MARQAAVLRHPRSRRTKAISSAALCRAEGAAKGKSDTTKERVSIIKIKKTTTRHKRRTEITGLVQHKTTTIMIAITTATLMVTSPR